MKVDVGVLARFLAKRKMGPSCWEWQGYRGHYGYGQLRVGGRKGKSALAHRLAWMFAHDEWPSGTVMHSCDNPSCVRPEHLSVGTPADNSLDMVMKERSSGRLSAVEVIDIRHSDLSDPDLAKLYGVTKWTIFDIKTRRTWKHLR